MGSSSGRKRRNAKVRKRKVSRVKKKKSLFSFFGRKRKQAGIDERRKRRASRIRRANASRLKSGGEETTAELQLKSGPTLLGCYDAKVCVTLIYILIVLTQLYYLTIVEKFFNYSCFSCLMLYRIIRICAALIGIIGVLCCKCCLVRVLLPFFLIIGSGSIAQDIYRHVPVMIEDESSGDYMHLMSAGVVFLVDTIESLLFIYCGCVAEKLYRHYRSL